MERPALLRTLTFTAIAGLAGYSAGRLTSPLSPGADKHPEAAAAPSCPASLPSTFSAQNNKPATSPEKIGTPSATASTPAKPTVDARLGIVLSRLKGDVDFQKLGGELIDWLAANPDEATAYLSNGSSGTAVADLFALWAQKDSHAASLWLSEHPLASGHDNMAAGLAVGVAREDRAASVKWVAAIKDPIIKLTAAREAGWTTYRNSGDEAAAGLRDAGIPDSAIAPIQEGWSKKLTALATRNAQNLVSIASSASAAGAPLEYADAGALVTALSTGVNGAGQFATTQFRIDTSDWTPREIAATQQMMAVSNNTASLKPSNH